MITIKKPDRTFHYFGVQSINEFYVVQKCQLADFEVLNLGKILLGAGQKVDLMPNHSTL